MLCAFTFYLLKFQWVKTFFIRILQIIKKYPINIISPQGLRMFTMSSDGALEILTLMVELNVLINLISSNDSSIGCIMRTSVLLREGVCFVRCCLMKACHASAISLTSM